MTLPGLFVIFSEGQHPIWIATHKWGTVKIPNGMRSADLRKLFTVGDAVLAFKVAVAPSLDSDNLSLHYELDREPIPLDCPLAALQLENSFENPLVIKSSSNTLSIKSKDRESVKYGMRENEMLIDEDSAVDFSLPPITTMTCIHKKVNLRGTSYFIGQCRAGDYVVHSWNPKDLNGYCGSEFYFLTDNGYTQRVKGPYYMSVNWRDYKDLVAHLNMPELNKKAFKVTVGRAEGSNQLGNRDFTEIVYQEKEFSVGPISSRILKEWYGLMSIRVEWRDHSSTSFPLVEEENVDERMKRFFMR